MNDEPHEEQIEYLACEKPKAQMSNEEVASYLEEYGYLSFSEMPEWLKAELRIRGWNEPTRNPTPREIRETEAEHFMHRVCSHELTIDDYLAHFRGERKIPR